MKPNTETTNPSIAERLHSVKATAPPADLLGKLNQDLSVALAKRSWDNAATDQTAIAAVRPWWRSSSLRAAAALIAVIGVTWMIQRQTPLGPKQPKSNTTLVTLDTPSERELHPENLKLTTTMGYVIEQGAATTAPTSDEEMRENQGRFGPGARTSGRGSPQPTIEPEPLDTKTLGKLANRRSKAAPKKTKAAQAGLRTDGPVSPVTQGASETDRLAGKSHEESVSVTAETPQVGSRAIWAGKQVTHAEPQKNPTQRNPRGLLNQPPGVQVDRTNVGGNESGQQAVFRAKGQAEPNDLTVDGVRITNLRATGASPTYNDFDQFAKEDAENDPARTPPGPSDVPAPHEKIFYSGPADPPRQTPPRRRIAQFDAMFFRDFGISPFVETIRDELSTFGLDADSGSYAIARSYLNRGALPPPESVRVEEFLNAFDYGEASPSKGDFRLTVEGALSPSNEIPESEYRRAWLRVAVKAREITAAQRQPAALTFLVDTSGSMQQGNRLEIVKDALSLLVDELTPRDSVAIVTFGSRGQVLLSPTSDGNAIRQTLRTLHPNGSTNLEEGMELAYEIASRNLRSGSKHRVILLSDGVANVGLSEPEALLRNVAQWAVHGIELTAIGIGMGNYNDALLERLADRGDGRYAYIDSLEEARRLFVEDLTGTLQTVASDARVQVAFDPTVVHSYRLIGYENRAIPDQQFRNPRTDAGEIGAGHTVTALYELELTGTAPRRSQLAKATLVYRSAESRELSEMSRTITLGQGQKPFNRASPALRLAKLTARFAELLRVSPYVTGDLTDLFLEAQKLIPEFPGNRDVVELTGLIGKARDLFARQEG